jgi:hypothetical protein
MSRKFLSLLVCTTVLLISGLAIADGGSPSPADDPRLIEFRFNPVRRAQVALWIEREGTTPTFRTLMLTEAVARRGIGNRPGASQMNSGFRWPYGRREGVLPVWANRRAASGALTFPRVIFRDRTSEGAASQAPAGHFPPTAGYRDNPDEYFCLSFRQALTNEERRREALDAVSCASTFNSDKGRYITTDDVNASYSEPQQTGPTTGTMWPLSGSSLYPPRRDVDCPASNCGNHPDVANYASDALGAMPEIDMVSRATLADHEQSILFTVPQEWPDGDYVAFLEVNVEGDYTDHEVGGEHPIPDYPTPQLPAASWDSWAVSTGYPYRGQPSVVYAIPFSLDHSGTFTARAPRYMGSIDGHDDASLHEIQAGDIVDDPVMAPGSGADRLRADTTGTRFRVRVQRTEVFGECTTDDDCDAPATCINLECVASFCSGNQPPDAMQNLDVEPVTDEKHSHQWGHLSFSVPYEELGIQRYEARVSTSPITDEASFIAAVPANAAAIDSVELVIPTGGNTGDTVAVDFGGLMPETRYYVGIRAIDVCNEPGPIATATLETTAIHFTTVSPCFVATAAYGSPLAAQIGALRRFRDRHLMNNAPGRALVSAYYAVGPSMANAIREHDSLRVATRVVLTPIVKFLAWLDAPDDSEQ